MFDVGQTDGEDNVNATPCQGIDYWDIDRGLKKIACVVGDWKENKTQKGWI